MDLYKFVKEHILDPNCEMAYEHVVFNENRISAEAYIGVGLNFKDMLKFGGKVKKENSRYRSKKVKTQHYVRGDDRPRMIFRFYKMDQPTSKDNKGESLPELRNIIDNLQTNKKFYLKHSKKFVDEKLVFFACVENYNDSQWPQSFLIYENSLDFDNLSQSIGKWNCVVGNEVHVDNSNAYIKLQLAAESVMPKRIMTCAYLHWI